MANPMMALGPGGMLPGGGATSHFGGQSPFVQGEWDWMQNPMMFSALMGAGGMFGQQQQPQQPMQAPQLPPMALGGGQAQLMPSPQTPMPQQRAPWWLSGGMFSG